MPGRSRHGGGNDAMRMVHEEYYDAPKPAPLPRVTEKRKATAVYSSTISSKAYGGYGSKNAGTSVGLPSIMPKTKASVRRPSYSREGGGDEAMAIVNDASWGSAEQRRYIR